MIKQIKTIIRELTKPLILNEVGNKERYELDFTTDEWASNVKKAKVLYHYIEPGSSILDIGCGMGGFLNVFKEKCEVEGIELSQKRVDIVNKKGIKCSKKDLSADDNIDKDYDYITLIHTIEHIQESEKVINKIKGRFRKNLIIGIPNAGFWLYRLRLLFGRFPLVGITGLENQSVKDHIRFWTVQDFKDWANYMDLDIVKIISFGSPKLLCKLMPNLFSTKNIFILENK